MINEVAGRSNLMLRRDRWTNGMTWRQILVALSPGFVGSGIMLVALWLVQR